MAQNVSLGRSLTAADQVSMDDVDHSIWNELLKSYVNDQGRVNYNAWQASQADSARLDDYLNQLSAASRSKSSTRQSQLAFWINAYNAVTVKGILREYPTSSIRNHTARFVGYNIWKNLLLTVGGTPISLDSIEHDVLRKMNEPRIHFAIVCASHSCPRLLDQAYTGARLDEQLVENTKYFFRQSGKFQARRGSKKVSGILDLEVVAEDFGSDQRAQLGKIAPYLPTEAAQAAAKSNSVSVAYLDYDWSLNEQKPEVQAQSGSDRSRR